MFNFNFYSNQMSQATRSMAVSTFFVGLMIIGIGYLAYAFRDIFALIAFFGLGIIGLSVIGFAIKLFIASWQMNRPGRGTTQYRDNVTIHRDEIDSDEW